MIEREKRILHYLTALDQGDFDAMSEIWEAATNDAELTLMLLEVHHVYDATSQPSLNGYKKEQKTVIAIKQQTTKPLSYGYPVGVIVAVLTIIAFGFIISANFGNRSQGLAQMPIPLNDLQPITADNLENLRLLGKFGHGAAYDIEWSPDGSILALGGTMGIDLRSTDNLEAEPFMNIHSSDIVSRIVFTPDGLQIVALRQADIAVWNVITGELIRTFPASGSDALFEISPDGENVAMTSCPVDEEGSCHELSLVIYDLATGDILEELELGLDRNAGEFNEDWSLFVYRVPNSQIAVLIDTTTGEEVGRYSFSGNQTPRFSPIDSDILLVTRGSGEIDKRLSLEDFENNTSRIYGAMSSDTFAPAIETAPNALIAMTGNGQINIVDITTNENTRAIDYGTSGYNTEDKLRFTEHQSLLAVMTTNVVRVWDVNSGTLVAQITDYWQGTTDLDVSPDNRFVAVGNGLGVLRYWNVATGAEIHLMGENDEIPIIQDVLFANEHTLIFTSMTQRGSTFATAYDNIHAYEFDLNTRVINGIGDDLVHAVTWTDRGLLGLSDDRQSINRWTLAEQEQTPMALDDVLSSGSNRFEIISTISRDGHLIASRYCRRRSSDILAYTCEDQVIDMWDAEIGLKILTLVDSTELYWPALGLDFSPDNRQLIASLCTDVVSHEFGGMQSYFCGTTGLFLWDIDRALNENDATLTPILLENFEGQWVSNINQFPEQHMLAATVFDRSYSTSDLVFWDISQNQFTELHRIPINGSARVTFSEDSKLMIVSRQGYIELWGVTD